MISARSMEARSASVLPPGDGWWFEPKWDGFRCLAFKQGREVRLQARSGKPLGRFFPDVAQRVAAIGSERFVLDGELLIAIDGVFSFEALQMRLHPAASRVARLAQDTPAILMLFDMLVGEDGEDLRTTAHRRRHEALEVFERRHGSDTLRLSEGTADRARAQDWLEEGRWEGVVAKRSDGPYAEGERAMIKVKRVRTADCVVGGFRYAEGRREVGSLLLGLYDEHGLLHHVGFTSGLANTDRPELTRRLEALRGGPGFTGRAPGGPSRWSTERSGDWAPLKPALVAEVSFDHVSAGRFRHGTRLLRFRPDKAPRQCTMEQLRQ